MSVADTLKTLGDRFQAGANVKNVYGDPVTVGDRTVIPVARVSYGFGGGGGSSAGQPEGGGGGGHTTATPAGIVEITPGGTRFIPWSDWRPLVSVGLVALVVGFVLGARTR